MRFCFHLCTVPQKKRFGQVKVNFSVEYFSQLHWRGEDRFSNGFWIFLAVTHAYMTVVRILGTVQAFGMFRKYSRSNGRIDWWELLKMS